MKIAKFLLILVYALTLSLQSLIADDAKMKKGLEIFNESAGCAGCHALKAAGAEGNVGPNLDTVDLTIESVVEMVTYGLGVMPAYGEEEILTKEEIDIVQLLQEGVDLFSNMDHGSKIEIDICYFFITYFKSSGRRDSYIS